MCFVVDCDGVSVFLDCGSVVCCDGVNDGVSDDGDGVCEGE